jgi:hypothetical protein
MQSLQSRILGAWPALRVKTPGELLRILKNKVLKASNDDKMHQGFGVDMIDKWIQLDPRNVRRPKEAPPDAFVIVGGMKDFGRDPANARLIRDDGAWLHFSITVRNASDILEICGYDFELVFPEDMVPPNGPMPSFYRIDLNFKDHPNEARELRSHCHPGHEELQAPAPVMTPDEILDLLIWGMRPRDPDKMRA